MNNAVKNYVAFLVVLKICSSLASEDDCSISETLFYEDLNCKPNIKETEKCPTTYECDSFEMKNDSCLLAGKSYQLGMLADEVTQGASCQVGCMCRKSDTSADFTCAILDCPEFLGVPIRSGCYRTYELGQCCSTGQICNETETDVTVCSIDDENYKEGEAFYPKNTCLKCICQKGFNGTLVEPFCKKQVCGIQLRHSKSLAQNCAPLYLGRSTCCPLDFICPSSSDDYKSQVHQKEGSQGPKCKFGQKELSIGDQMLRPYDNFGKEHVTCECRIPPLLTCIAS